MLTAQGTLTINAAFLQEIKEENRELQQVLEDCAKAIGGDGAASREPKPVVDLLARLRDQLAMHFALEEAYGYFDDAIQVTPQFTDRALKLRGQHGDLFLQLGAIVEQAEQMLYEEQVEPQLAGVARDFHRFRSRFQEHEARETDLIVEMVNQEIGCGD
jgi:hemerythrin HHE cation binding domain-containing protein